MATTGHHDTGQMYMKLLTVQEVADTIKVSEKTVRRLIKSGELVAYKVGERGQLRVKEDELERYVEAQRIQVEDEADGVRDQEATESNDDN